MSQYGLTAPMMEQMKDYQGADTKSGDLTFGIPDKNGKINSVVVPRKTFDDQLMPGYREFYQGGAAPVKPKAVDPDEAAKIVDSIKAQHPDWTPSQIRTAARSMTQ